VVTKVSEATEEDVDIAVEAAQKAFETTWGLNASGSVRSNLLWKLAQLMERDLDELAALEAMDNGTPPFSFKIIEIDEI
jgi:aldehyde dehydrogenase (NAD+)